MFGDDKKGFKESKGTFVEVNSLQRKPEFLKIVFDTKAGQKGKVTYGQFHSCDDKYLTIVSKDKKTNTRNVISLPVSNVSNVSVYKA